MTWVRRKGSPHRYYVRSLWKEGRTTQQYLGRGEAARWMARFDELRQRQKAEAQKAVEEELSCLRAADELLEALDQCCPKLVPQYLRAAGFHQHHRSWRKKRMEETTTENLIQSAEKGDPKALALL